MSTCHEEAKIYRKPAHEHFEGGGSWNTSGKLGPPTRVQQSNIYKWKAKYGGMSVSEVKRMDEEVGKGNRQIERSQLMIVRCEASDRITTTLPVFLGQGQHAYYYFVVLPSSFRLIGGQAPQHSG